MTNPNFVIGARDFDVGVLDAERLHLGHRSSRYIGSDDHVLLALHHKERKISDLVARRESIIDAPARNRSDARPDFRMLRGVEVRAPATHRVSGQKDSVL